MNTRLLMIASALFTGLLGLSLTFFPEELLSLYGIAVVAPLPKIIQLLGAAYLGYAMMNWMAKGQLFGGIYGRPMAMGNMLHYFAGAAALLKNYQPLQHNGLYLAVMGLYVLFAILFGYLLFTSPKRVYSK